MNFTLLILVFFTIGLAVYHLDKKYSNIFKKWYNIWNKEELSQEIGFVYNQPFNKAIVVAIIIASVKAILFSVATASHPLIEIMNIIPESLAIVGGFYSYNGLSRVWEKKNKFAEIITESAEDIKNATKKAKEEFDDSKEALKKNREASKEAKAEEKAEKKSTRDKLKEKGLL